MSGMEPMLIGAALGGGISAARGGNPLTGALLGGIGGGVYGAASGAAGAAAAPAAAETIAAQPALSYAGAQTAAGQAMTNPGLFEVAKAMPQGFSAFAQNNPLLMNAGSSALQTQFQHRPLQMAQGAGLTHGQGIQAPSLLNSQALTTPQISLI